MAQRALVHRCDRDYHGWRHPGTGARTDHRRHRRARGSRRGPAAAAAGQRIGPARARLRRAICRVLLGLYAGMSGRQRIEILLTLTWRPDAAQTLPKSDVAQVEIDGAPSDESDPLFSLSRIGFVSPD